MAQKTLIARYLAACNGIMITASMSQEIWHCSIFPLFHVFVTGNIHCRKRMYTSTQWVHAEFGEWASCQLRKITGCACAGNAGNVSPPPRVSDPDMHHGTCATHVPWCMPGSLTDVLLWSRWRRKRSRHSRRMRNPQFYVSGKRPMPWNLLCATWLP